MNKVSLFSIYFLTFLILFAKEAQAADMCVDPGGTGTHTSIQSALSGAQNSGTDDTIKVVQGIYKGRFEYQSTTGNNISLCGGYVPGTSCSQRALDPTNTVIDAENVSSLSVLDLRESAGGDITLEGFTIQNGSGNYAGGVRAQSLGSSFKAGGDVTLSNNIIKDNTATYDWGGVFAYSQASTSGDAGDITLTNNIITGNTAGSQHAGVYARSVAPSGTAGDVILTNNTITANTAASSYGGVYAYSDSYLGTAGGVTLTNNIITGNIASQCSGIYAVSNQESNGTSGTVTLVNNTITRNRSTGTSGYAGGLFLKTIGNNTVNCFNNIIWNNTGATGGDIFLADTLGTANGYNNNYSDMSGTWDNSGGETDIDPQFIDPDNGDFRLRSSSPCIDAGETSVPTPPGLPSTDFEGDSRIIDSTVDIGADEVSVVTTCVNTGTALYNALFAAESNNKGDVIMIQQGTYTRTGNFTYISSDGNNIALLGGYTSSCVSRNINPVNTILDAESNFNVLELINSSGGDITVDGFTIQNGGGLSSGTYYGAGVFAQSSKTSGPSGKITIKNNKIIENIADTSGGGAYIISNTDSGTAGDIIITNNIIAENSAPNYGGGLYAESYTGSGTAGTITCTNNTISGNNANNGGGVWMSLDTSGGTINCYNNIIWGNTASSSGDDIFLSKSSGNAYGYNNDYAALAGSSWDSEESKINANPLLTGNYHLKSRSPCIDTGTNAAPSFPAMDFEGDDRSVDGNRDGTTTVDIGADEFVPSSIISNIFILLFQ